MRRRAFLLPGLLLAAWAAALTGCWDDTVNVEFEDPPVTATVAGRVLAWEDGTPVPDAVITIPASGRRDTTGADGGFQFTGIAPGTYQANIASPGRLGLTTELAVPGAGKVDRDHWHLDVAIPARSRDVAFTVRDAGSGAPLEGVAVTLQDLDLGGEIGTVSITAGQDGLAGVTAAGGEVVLTGLPACEVEVAVAAADLDGDGLPDRAGRLLTLDLRDAAAPQQVDLLAADAPQSPQLIASPLADEYGEAPLVTAPTLVFEFDQPMNTDPLATVVELIRAKDRGRPRDRLLTAWPTPTRLEVTTTDPQDEVIMVGVLAYAETGYGAVTAGFVDWRTTGEDDDAPPCADVVDDLALSGEAGNLDFDSTRFELAWNALPEATGYAVYARDDHAQTDWVLVTEMVSDWDAGTMVGPVVLPPMFDRDPDDGIQTPLAGTTVELSVVPLNAADPGPGAPHAVLAVGDGVAPDLVGVSAAGELVNEGDAPTTVEVVVTFSEFLDSATPAPTLTVEEAGGDPAFALDPAAATWSWSASRRSGRFQCPLPAGADATGDIVRVTVASLTDLSGNTTSGPVTSEPLTLVGGYRFDFESGPQGWTVETGSGTAWELGTPSSGPGGAHSGANCWGTNLAGDYQNSTRTSLISPPLDLAMAAPRLQFQGWFDQENCCDRTYLEIDAGGGWVLVTTYVGTMTPWTAYTADLSAYQGQTVQLRLRFESDYSVIEPGAFIDDIEIQTAP